MSLQDIVHQIVLEKGPMLPAEIVSNVNRVTGKVTDMFFVGAILSELMASKHMKMSYAKIGGSRVYYCDGQEEKLSKLYDYLSDKHKKAYDILKKQQVVRAIHLEPVIRVAMQDLKDFAVPLDVKLNEKETFFKWYLLPMEDVQAYVKDIMKSEIEAMKKDAEKTTASDSSNTSGSEQRTSQSSSSSSSSSQSSQQSQQRETTQQREAEENSKQQSRPLQSQSSTIESNPTSSSSKQKDEFILSSFNSSSPSPSSNQKTSEPSNPKKAVPEKQSTLSGSEDAQDPFVQKALNYFQKQNIDITEITLLKKDSEAEFEGRIKSQIGMIYYYFFAKQKKKITESDLSYAYVRAQNKNLPLCFISPGELTKRAEEILVSDLKSATFLKL
jgi:hypothetical protein